MAKPRTIEHRKIAEVLADGLWHDFEKVVWEVAKVVPVQHAIRTVERERQAYYKARKLPVPPRKRGAMTHEEQIRSGSRALAISALRSRVFQVAVNIHTGDKQVRLRPKPPADLLPDHLVEPKGNRKPGAFHYLSKEEQEKALAETRRKMRDTNLRNKGIDPENHITQRERERLRKERIANETPEERAARLRATGLKSWETRLKREAKHKEQEGGTDGS